MEETETVTSGYCLHVPTLVRTQTIKRSIYFNTDMTGHAAILLHLVQNFSLHWDVRLLICICLKKVLSWRYTDGDKNKTPNSVFHDVTHKFYQSIRPFKNVIQFHSRQAYAISFIQKVGKYSIPWTDFHKTLNSIMCICHVPHFTQIWQQMWEEWIDIHLQAKVWLSLHWFS